MRKGIYYVLACCLILIGTLPGVIGIFFEKNFVRVLDIINADKRIKIETLYYHRGWLTSKASIRITLLDQATNYPPPLNMALPPSGKMVFVLQENIKHGPIIYDNDKLKIGYANIHSSLLLLHSKNELMYVNLLSAFNDSWYGKFATPVWNFSFPPYINKISVQKFSGEFSLQINDKHIEHIKTTTLLGPVLIDFTDNNSYIKQLSIQEIKGSYDAVHEQEYLWSGKSSMYTPGIIIAGANNNNFVIEKMAITNTFSTTGNILYSNNLTLFIKSLQSPSYSIPAFSKLQIVFAARNFNAEGLNNYVKQMTSSNSGEFNNIDLTTLESLLAHMVTQASIITSTITSDTSLGAFSGRTKTIWPPSIPLPNSIDDIIKRTETTINLRMSNLLVMKLLTIYGDQITASGAELDKIKQKTEVLEDENFKNQQASKETDVKKTVDQLLASNQITPLLSTQILELANQNQPLAKFSSNIDQLSLPFDIKNKLKLIYQIQLETNKTISLDTKNKELMSDLLSIGYLSKDPDKDEYTSKIIIRNGTIFIGGGPLLTGRQQQEAGQDN